MADDISHRSKQLLLPNGHGCLLHPNDSSVLHSDKRFCLSVPSIGGFELSVRQGSVLSDDPQDNKAIELCGGCTCLMNRFYPRERMTLSAQWTSRMDV